MYTFSGLHVYKDSMSRFTCTPSLDFMTSLVITWLNGLDSSSGQIFNHESSQSERRNQLLSANDLLWNRGCKRNINLKMYFFWDAVCYMIYVLFNPHYKCISVHFSYFVFLILKVLITNFLVRLNTYQNQDILYWG